jgi:ribonuclease R
MGKREKTDQFEDREAAKYEHPIPSREFILEHLTERGRPATRKQLVTELNLESDYELEAFRRRLGAMVRDGQLHKTRRGTYGLIEKMELISGHVIGHKDGFGFVVPVDGGDDLFLNARQMRLTFHGDKVLARVSGMDHRGRSEAIVVEVLEHNTQQLVGRFCAESGSSFVEPSNQRITQEILIPAEDIGDAEHGQMVVVAITTQPAPHTRPVGKIIEVLGDHMAPGMEINVAIRNHDLPHIWPEDVLAEAAKFPATVPADAIKDRLDLRKLPFVTIDGEDAKDFDDAVYCTPSGKGWILYVAIADVGHYVKPGTPLDTEAYERGNSVYFPEQVIPMLPEALSNGLCSLKPEVDRLTMVCEMHINATGKITKYEFHEAVIHSHARLTYNKVHAIEQGDAELQTQYKALLPDIKNLYAIYHILHEARIQRGSIDFDMPETKIVFGAARKIERIVPTQRNDAHKLIEECMLCANICAAKFLLKNDYPALFRVHEGPSEEKLQDLRKFLGEMGLKLPGSKEPQPSDYAAILASIADRPDAHLIQTVLLRSLSQAVYSAENKGHFGLAFDAYAHFTSPIRRYPDLIVHRAIRNVLRHKVEKNEVALSLLDKQGSHCSVTERRADDATREVIDWLKCEFMLDKVGEEFDGVITSVTGFGFFVELKDIYVEGLVHISTLPNDYYQFDASKQAMLGERAGRRFRLGDVVRIRVVRVDLDQRQIDFMLAEVLDKPVRGEKGKSRDKDKPEKTNKNNRPKKKKRSKKSRS